MKTFIYFLFYFFFQICFSKTVDINLLEKRNGLYYEAFLVFPLQVLLKEMQLEKL